MTKRDILNRELYQISRLKGADYAKIRSRLTIQIKGHTQEIKQLFPKNLDDKMGRYLNGRYKPADIRKLRSNF